MFCLHSGITNLSLQTLGEGYHENPATDSSNSDPTYLGIAIMGDLVRVPFTVQNYLSIYIAE